MTAASRSTGKDSAESGHDAARGGDVGLQTPRAGILDVAVGHLPRARRHEDVLHLVADGTQPRPQPGGYTSAPSPDWILQSTRSRFSLPSGALGMIVQRAPIGGCLLE